jgi:DNA-binding NarL/FixJ family response regulator
MSSDRPSHLRVVLVDDHAGFRRAARALLEADGFEIVGEAADGASGIDAVARLRPDGVILDVRLPDTDGLTVARTLMSSAWSPSIVLISSRSLADLGRPQLPEGVRGFLMKDGLTASALRGLFDG